MKLFFTETLKYVCQIADTMIMECIFTVNTGGEINLFPSCPVKYISWLKLTGKE